MTDTERLDWLITNGFAPARWREPTVNDFFAGRVSDNGLVYEGVGGREEIDAAIEKERLENEKI